MLEGRESAVWSRSSFLHAETAHFLFLRVKAFQFFCMQSKIRVVFPFLVIPAIKALNCGGFLREKLKRGREKSAPIKLCLEPRFSKTMPWELGRREGGTTSKSGGTRRMHNAVVHVHPSWRWQEKDRVPAQTVMTRFEKTIQLNGLRLRPARIAILV